MNSHSYNNSILDGKKVKFDQSCPLTGCYFGSCFMAWSNKGQICWDVASTFTSFIRNFWNCKKFAFWADNCSGQSKNWFLYTLLVNEVNHINSTANEIVIKYFNLAIRFCWHIASTTKLNKVWKRRSELKIYKT